jgi:hypothetical protein
MKIALYIEDGLEQIVLTPETETERGIVGKLVDGSRQLSIKRGGFYACQGGWTRHRREYSFSQFNQYGDLRDDDSTIIVLRPIPEEAQTEENPEPAP